MAENQQVYNLPTCKGFKIKNEVFIIKNGKTLKMKFSELSNDLNKVLTKNG